MGRAIDMENDIHELKIKVRKLEDIVRGMTHTIDELDEKSTKTTHIDLVDDVKEEETNGKEEANDKGTSKASGVSDAKHGDSKSKNTKHRKSAK